MSTDSQQEPKKYDLLAWRYQEEIALAAKGCNQSEIARVMKLDPSTISKDFKRLRQQAKADIKRYLDETLPFEYKKCLVALDEVTKNAWLLANHNNVDPRTRVAALALAKDCAIEKMDLLTHTQTINDAITFMSTASAEVTSLAKEEPILDIEGPEKGNEAQFNEIF